MNIPDDPKDDKGFEALWRWLDKFSKALELAFSLLLFAAALFVLWALWDYITHVRG